MLEPHDRTLLFDVLKPPDNHTLDAAIATTYTLDLVALLTAPVAFSLFEVDDHRELLDRDSLALLESLRRYADKITLFCHAGLISLPAAQFPQFEFLERSVVECLPRVRGAAFHPKIWLLRFVNPEGGVTYRFVCSTRNLTFDRCWDTVLTLEGPVLDRQRAIAANNPLGDFVRSLPSFVTRPLNDEVGRRIALFESEVRRVDFAVPDGFESYEFHTFGHEGQSRFPFDRREGRLLIVSPFVSAGGIERLTKDRQGTLLITRPETLQQPDCGLERMAHCYVLSSQAEEEPEAVKSDVDLTRGLHAKAYLIDAGWKSHLFTGSANATEAAFNGNVEILVELVGSKTKQGIDTLFKRENGKTCLADLLEESTPKPMAIDEEQEGIRATVDRTRDSLVALTLSADVVPAGEHFTLRISSATTFPMFEPGVKVTCWPVTLARGKATELLAGSAEAMFRALSLRWRSRRQ
jgi:hypothetical protein